MGGTVGRVVRSVVTAMFGVILGFFVAVSAFADGSWEERADQDTPLLLGYGLAGVALGWRASARYGLGLATPGMAALAFFALSGEGAWWNLIYAAAITALAVGGAYAGANRWPGSPTRDGVVA